MLMTFIQCNPSEKPIIQIQKEDRIALIGNNLCARMMHFGHFETELQVQYPCLLYTSPSPRDKRQSRMPSSA